MTPVEYGYRLGYEQARAEVQSLAALHWDRAIAAAQDPYAQGYQDGWRGVHAGSHRTQAYWQGYQDAQEVAR